MYYIGPLGACLPLVINSVHSIPNRIENATHLNPQSPESCPIIFFIFKVHVHVYFDVYIVNGCQRNKTWLTGLSGWLLTTMVHDALALSPLSLSPVMKVFASKVSPVKQKTSKCTCKQYINV